MKRYQLYLNPHSVSVLDEVEKISDISRSKLIRDVIDRCAELYVTIFAIQKKDQTYTFLDKLDGFIDAKTDEKTHFADHVDDIYRKDW